MHNNELTGQRFFLVTLLNVLITVAEFLGGALSGSLSLVSDAFHNLGDSFSVVLSYWTHRISSKPQTEHNTFGFRRSQILSAFLNSIFLVVVSIILLVGAIKKLFHPEHINGNLMLIVAIIGTIANLISALMLNAGSKHNLNIRATYLHLLSDTLSSMGIIAGGILIDLYNWVIVDPIVTLLVAFYIIYETIPIIKKTIAILMQGAPTNIDYADVQKDLLNINGITNVHHVHVWMIDENTVVFSAHINMKNMMISDAEKFYHPIYELLHKKYGITHVTVQVEVERGIKQDLFYDTGKDIK
ncbi:cobalt transporter [Philodulcilactobacillus myokoensis]|uniref:Cobalt transporter n=1 Tax=Philodulcilactobacillus myokoensis TaxID=2929573 RepID=A0A9W6ESQ2_9LACO|nr:cation diffusion facilitator family transporter [Philodulcilactobacillus myokoensis]GLB46583.1 cobalt transporter [Philodulcilactobacillus myokoensis]